MIRLPALILFLLIAPAACTPAQPDVEAWPQYAASPFEIELAHPIPPETVEGGIFAHDCNADGLLDFVLTSPGRIGVYDHGGARLWSIESPIQLSGGDDLPGIHHPGAFAGDVDADGKAEIGWMTREGQLVARDAATGLGTFTREFPGAKVALIANLRGAGDADAILQYSQSELRAIRLDTGAQLWHTTRWLGTEHGPARLADIDNDGRDEVVGIVFIDDDGSVMNPWNLKRDLGAAVNSMDSVVIADIVPGGALEVGLAEQGGNNQAIVVSPHAILWGKFHRPETDGECAREIDPDKLAVGNFDLARDGLEIFCRSACGREPWVFDARGELIANWRVEQTAPVGWFLGGPRGPEDSEGGLEEVVAISWRGPSHAQLILGKERHVEGSTAIVNPLTGEFVMAFPTRAARVYAADVSGDVREEVVVVEASRDGGNGKIRIFFNGEDVGDDKSRSGGHHRLWDRQHYRRQKQNWNYYSP